MRIDVGVGDLVRRIRDDQAQVSGQKIKRLGDVVCHLHHTCGGDETCVFSSLASKPVAMVTQWFGHKTTVTISWFGLKSTAIISWFGPQNQGRRFGDLGLKITTIVSWFGPQNHSRRFGDLGLKIIVTVSWFGHQNQVGGGLLVWASKPMSG
jgi:hypothetical protein